MYYLTPASQKESSNMDGAFGDGYHNNLGGQCVSKSRPLGRMGPALVGGGVTGAVRGRPPVYVDAGCSTVRPLYRHNPITSPGPSGQMLNSRRWYLGMNTCMKRTVTRHGTGECDQQLPGSLQPLGKTMWWT